MFLLDFVSVRIAILSLRSLTSEDRIKVRRRAALESDWMWSASECPFLDTCLEKYKTLLRFSSPKEKPCNFSAHLTNETPNVDLDCNRLTVKNCLPNALYCQSEICHLCK